MDAKSAFVLTSGVDSSAKAGVEADGWDVSGAAKAGVCESADGVGDDSGIAGLREDNQSGVSAATDVLSTSGEEEDDAGGALVCGAAALSQSGRSEEEPNEAGGSEAFCD